MNETAKIILDGFLEYCHLNYDNDTQYDHHLHGIYGIRFRLEYPAVYIFIKDNMICADIGHMIGDIIKVELLSNIDCFEVMKQYIPNTLRLRAADSSAAPPPLV